MDNVNIIILYIRISMEDVDIGIDGKDESDSIANQRNILRSFVDSQQEFHGSKILELCDEGYTGTNFERPAVQELLQRAREKQVDCIIVKDFSRFGRDYLTVSDYVDQIFPFLGIRFISLNDGYDSANLNGTTSGLDMAFRNVVNAFYSKDISEKVRSSKRAKAQQGAYLSSFAPIGYRKDGANKNRLVIEGESAEIVRRIFLMSGAGLSVAEIARLLNSENVPTPSKLKAEQGFRHKWWYGLQGEKLWDLSSITRILRDERYLGKAVYGRKCRSELGNYRVRNAGRENWIVVPDCHEPIVSTEEFQAAQQTLKRYSQVKNRKDSKHLFIGKIRCGECGYALICEGKVRPRYRCLTKQRTFEYDCIETGIPEVELTEIVWQTIQLYCHTLLERNVHEQKENGRDRISVMQKQITVYQRSCKNLDEQKAILYEKLLDGDLIREQYPGKRDALVRQQEELQKKIVALEEKLRNLRGVNSDESLSVKTLTDYLQPDRLTREMVMAFVDCIYVYDREMIKIEWLFNLE
ncbi:MAG: recombinase family protein [Lachnospiraceae bacterium]